MLGRMGILCGGNQKKKEKSNAKSSGVKSSHGKKFSE